MFYVLHSSFYILPTRESVIFLPTLARGASGVYYRNPVNWKGVKSRKFYLGVWLTKNGNLQENFFTKVQELSGGSLHTLLCVAFLLWKMTELRVKWNRCVGQLSVNSGGISCGRIFLLRLRCARLPRPAREVLNFRLSGGWAKMFP
jgi:hypothetical protein